MKQINKQMVSCLAALVLAAMAINANAADQKAAAKPYPLDTCIVSDEKLGGDMGKPYVFIHEGREVKLCCSSCLKDFKKDPAKYINKIEEAEAKTKK
jgi:hypothetical protein